MMMRPLCLHCIKAAATCIQAINSIARELDRDGSRTIAVITKPDNIPTGTHAKWLALARNQVGGGLGGWLPRQMR